MNQNCNPSCSNCDAILQANKRCQYLLSSFTHEVRNPLTLIYSSLQLIEKRCPDVTQTGLWPQVKQDVQDTIRLLKDLSVSDETETLAMQQFNLSYVLEKLASSCRSYMESQNIALRTDIASDLPSIFGNETRLKQAILNLLLNAGDAVRGQTDASVCLRAYVQNDQLSIHVRDNGPGIPESKRTSIFEPFVTHKSSGTGLGLSIIREIVQQHGGILTLTSDTSSSVSYTDFCIQLPVHADLFTQNPD